MSFRLFWTPLVDGTRVATNGWRSLEGSPEAMGLIIASGKLSVSGIGGSES
jgi:hypothetical protein